MASANPNQPYGFRAVRNQNGDYPVAQARIASGSVALPTGSIARLKTDGSVAIWDGTFTNGSKQLLGEVAAGCRSTDSVRTVYIFEDPNQQYEAQLSDGTVTGPNGLYGRCFRGTAMTSKNTTLNQSVAAINGATGTSVPAPASGSAVAFQAVRYSGEVGNIISNSFARVIVKIRPEYLIFGTSTATV